MSRKAHVIFCNFKKKTKDDNELGSQLVVIIGN
jgi:hypothetical protein